MQVVALGATARAFCIPLFQALSKSGYDVVLVSSPDDNARKAASSAAISLSTVPMRTGISPLADLLSLWRLFRLFRKARPKVVHVHMSKAGVLAIPAAWLAGVPLRVYNNHGMAFISSVGLKRWLLKTCERLTCRLATDVLFVSNSVLNEAVHAGLVTPPKGRVIGPGTISGVDCAAFDPDQASARSLALRQQYGIPSDAHIIGFVGRLVPHKGVALMLEAWRSIPPDLRAQCYLCFFGPRDNAAMGALVDQAAADPELHVKNLGFQSDMPAWYATMTLLASPSWHEGFPYNVLEASTSRVPVVGTRVSGTVDAVVDQVTGILTPAGDAQAMAEAIMRLLSDEQLRKSMGDAGRKRMLEQFSRERIVALTLDEYAQFTSRINDAPHPQVAKSAMTRLVYLTTHPTALRDLLRGQLAFCRENGFEVIAIASPDTAMDQVAKRERVQTISVPIEREISPLKDLRSLWRLFRLFRKLRPDIVNAGTAKAGLLGMLAACIARVPVRIYALHGLRLETTTGVKRRVLLATERIASACAHRVIAVSRSLGDRCLQLGLVPPEKLVVIGGGSANGVDLERFGVSPELRAKADKLRADWGVPSTAPIIGFVGRLVRDKGIGDLIDAFDVVLGQYPDARLLLVGRFEEGDPVEQRYLARIRSDNRILRPGFVEDPPIYYAAMQLLALPSYREGFPTVPLEAAAAGLPTVAYQATGIVDAVRNDVTGILVPIGDRAALAAAMLKYLRDDALRAKHGAAGFAMAQREYRPEIVWQGIVAEYRQLIAQHCPPAP